MRKKRDWQRDAACLDVDPELFFVHREGPKVQSLREQQALAYCEQCPVRQHCLDYATGKEDPNHREEYGIWGGQTEDTRRSIKRHEDEARWRANREELGQAS